VYVLVIVALAPLARAPIAHGYALAHAPLLPTKARPAGVGSDTTTFAAESGPFVCAPTRAGLAVRIHAWRVVEADRRLH
jgi:hypothetical protein